MEADIPDCLIVGAGPVGLTLGCQFHQYGIAFRIIDKLPGPVKRTKAAAVWSRTAEIFDQMNLTQRFLEEGVKVFGASFFAGGKRVARLTLDSIDSVHNYVLMLAQHKTEEVLRTYLEEKGASVDYNCAVVSVEERDDLVEVTLDNGQTLTARYLIACDGAHSQVRQSAGLSFEGRELESQWVVADAEIEGLPFDDEILLIMHQDGPTGLFPLGDSLYRIVGQTEPVADQTTELAEQAVRELVGTRVQSGNLKLGKVTDAGFFSINERQVDRYRKGRIFLAGDAAHVQSPLGGQGMNTGIQDAHNLAWKLAMVCKGDLNPKVLDTYHEERHPIGKWLVEATSRGTDMLTNRQPIVAAFRDQAARFVASLPPVQNKLRNTLSEVEINYRSSSLSREPAYVGAGWRYRQGIRPGERAPDGLVRYNDLETRLSSHLRGRLFHLLLFDSGRSVLALNWETLLKQLQEHHCRRVDTVLVSTLSANREKLPCPFLEDFQEELHHLYSAIEPCAYLIRPDGYIAYRSQPVDKVELLNYLDEWSV